MKRSLICLSFFMAFSAFVKADTGNQWSYEGLAGPEHWGELGQEYHMCHDGKFQSPIDIKNVINGELPPLKIEFHKSAESIVNNGHTIQVDVNDEDDFIIDGEVFNLKQYHFHAPGENLINGKSFPLEAHFVHANDKGELAVVGVMYEVGEENPAIETLIKKIPGKTNDKISLVERVDLSALFPTDHHYYRFSGSLTTPPCSEGLRWFIMKQPVQISQSQLKVIQDALKGSNNRPVQPLNGRVIVQ
ncbi:carbonic anhydrase [Pantoea ananatis]|uniref:carbonic anhydrase n=1 Tax=Pantoea ananas TaxID=553 RepID=UPI0007DACD2A|nr:carbonic anhydrase family protein [Pantoea ananatis]MCW0347802.1 Carbonic anhydrase [Pantoea ananatis]UYL00153.1 carbonic anhydrase family protein [Pantoea ananatis]